MTPEQTAWLAGLFEGEGCILHTRVKPPKSRRTNGETARRLAISMTDEDVIRRVHAITGVGAVKIHPRRHGWKTAYVWQCCRWADIERILTAILPYLGERRSAKARALLADPPNPVGGQVKTHCKRGHPFTGPGSDVYLHCGVRHCRHCARVRLGKVAA